MTTISAKDVKALRDATGAGMMDCKRALEENGGDVDEAMKTLRAKGLADAAKRAGRAATAGLVDAYIHTGGQVGVLVEVNCETDFVARTEQFQKFVHDVALQIAATKPRFVSVEEIPEEFREAERAVFTQQAAEQGIAEAHRAKAVEGKLAKSLRELCLLDQEFVFDQGQKEPRTIEAMRAQASADLGENIVIRRFSLFELGK
ncbi:MAG: translation elongation factor Ts [Actinomycetota bacterium]